MISNKLMPFHLFQCSSEGCIINIDKMQAYPVDHITYSMLKALSTRKEIKLPPDFQETLRQFGLIPSDTDKRKSAVLQKHMPITHMALLVTRSCNLRCVYCYEDKTDERMDVKTAFQAVDWLIRKSENMRTIHIVFFGGEPMLNYSLIQSVVEYTEKETHKAGKNAAFSITTNGTLLDNDKNLFLKKHHFKVVISFDGIKELQDSQRPYASGCGSYDLTVPKIKKLLELMPQTAGHAVIMGDTSPEIVKNALQELGFYRVSAAMNSQSLFTDSPEEEISGRNTRSMLSALEEEAGIWHRYIGDRKLSSLKKLIERSYLYSAMLCLLNHTKKYYFCGAGQGMTAVTPSGDIYLCHRFVGLEAYKIGSIYSFRLDMEKFSQSPVETNDICSSCFARYYCGGGCKHDHVSFCGSIDKPEERMCLVKQRELELAASVIARMSPEEQSWLVNEDIFPPKPCPFDF